MQLRRGLAPLIVAMGISSVWIGPSLASPGIDEQESQVMMQYFSDSKHVAVRSAIGEYKIALDDHSSLSLHWNNERVRVPAISAPPGSQQAVDAITTASRPISGNAFQDFVKVRNELQGGLKRGGAEVDYYVSDEADYLGQQLAASYARDVLDAQTNLSVGSSYGWDSIHPLADDNGAAAASKTTLHGNAVLTRVISPNSMLRFGVEYNHVEGLQHNPYRDVYAGGSIVPERHPDRRERRDAFLKLNQYFANRSSLKLGYRFYNDDWGINSHEIESKLSQYLTRGAFASYEYRYYTQTSADFYRSTYVSPTGVDGYLTGDYRMAALSSHFLGVGVDVDFSALDLKQALLRRMGVQCGYQRYFNSNNYSADILTTQLDIRF
ncbi:MAG TPA: DUF3570 domain-containing protein [Candidatus Udaeobacter sp.]|nr:DUF3570 domain-containing protein [Candidatus Udaeobacter sp.]